MTFPIKYIIEESYWGYLINDTSDENTTFWCECGSIEVAQKIADFLNESEGYMTLRKYNEQQLYSFEPLMADLTGCYMNGEDKE